PPTRYFLRYVDNQLYAKEVARVDGFEDAVNPNNILCLIDAETLRQALTTVQELEQTGTGTTITIYERINIREVEHSKDHIGPPDWEWEEQLADIPEELELLYS